MENELDHRTPRQTTGRIPTAEPNKWQRAKMKCPSFVQAGNAQTSEKALADFLKPPIEAAFLRKRDGGLYGTFRLFFTVCSTAFWREIRLYFFREIREMAAGPKRRHVIVKLS